MSDIRDLAHRLSDAMPGMWCPMDGCPAVGWRPSARETLEALERERLTLIESDGAEAGLGALGVKD